MAITWGSQVTGTSGRKFQIGFEFVVTAQSDSSVTVRLDIYFKGTYGVNDTSNTLTVSGGVWSAGGAVTVVASSNQEVQIWQQSQTFAKTYGATQAKSFAASLSGLDVYGTGTTATLPTHTYTVAARPYEVPTPPSSLTATRISDTQTSLAWTRNDSDAGKYQSQRVRRQQRIAGTWGGWSIIEANLAANATSYVAATTADGDFRFAIDAVNTAGFATSTTAQIQTTPTTPSALAAVRDGADIVLTVAPATSMSDATHPVEVSTDGGSSWSALTTLAAGITTYRHVSPNPALPYTYRVRALSAVGSLPSATWRTSNTVSLEAPPNAPTNLSPSGIWWPATVARTLAWVHNPTDASPQRKYQLRTRAQGDPTWVNGSEITSASSSASVTPSSLGMADGTPMEWAVRTWGAHSTAGDWSATATLNLATVPTATIDTPEPSEVVGLSEVTVTFAYYQAQSQTCAGWRVRLLLGGVEVESRAGAGNPAPVTFTRLADGGAYTVEAEVQAASGLWSAADSVSFSVAYLPPAGATVTHEWDRTLGRIVLTVNPDDADEDETVPVVAITVERALGAGDFETLFDATPATAGTVLSLADTACLTRGVNRYRVWTVSAIPSRALAAEFDVIVDEDELFYLSMGDGWGDVFVLRDNIEVSHIGDVAKALHDFGRGAPVAMFGKATSEVLSVRCELFADDADTRRIEMVRAAKRPTTVLLRGATHEWIHGVIDGGIRGVQDWAPLAGVEFTVREVSRA